MPIEYKSRAHARRIERIRETRKYREIRYAVRSFLKSLHHKDMEAAGSMLRIMIHSTVEGKE